MEQLPTLAFISAGFTSASPVMASYPHRLNNLKVSERDVAPPPSPAAVTGVGAVFLSLGDLGDVAMLTS